MIREYTAGPDDDPIVDIYVRASNQAHPFLSDAFMAREADNVRSLYLPKAQTFVAEQGGAVVGFISLLGPEVGGLFVDPQKQGGGHGQALLTRALEVHPALELDVFKDNPIGRRFYARFGFVEQDERFDDYCQQPVIRLRFETAAG